MAQWGKRRMAGLVRGVLIGTIIAIMIMLFYFTGIFEYWLSNINWGIGMVFQIEFYAFLGIMITFIGLISFLVRSWINWGGA